MGFYIGFIRICLAYKYEGHIIMVMKIKQQGFALLEVVIIIVIITMIGGVGYYFFTNKDSAGSTSSSASQKTEEAKTNRGVIYLRRQVVTV